MNQQTLELQKFVLKIGSSKSSRKKKLVLHKFVLEKFVPKKNCITKICTTKIFTTQICTTKFYEKLKNLQQKFVPQKR